MNAINVLFDHWIFKLGILDFLVTDNANEPIHSDFTQFCRVYNVQFKPRTPYAPCSKGVIENSNIQLEKFLCTVVDTQYDT